MSKTHKKMSKKIGMKPGSVVYVGRERQEPVNIDIIDYTENDINLEKNISIEQSITLKDKPTVSWININGIHDTDLIQQLGNGFNINELVLEDIVNTTQRPKLEESKEFVFVSLKMLLGFDQLGDIKTEQISVLFGKGWVLTFQETGDDVFDSVRNRIAKTIPRIRLMRSDYLAYALIDTAVDHYFTVLEEIGAKIDILDEAISEKPIPEHLNDIRKLKRQLIYLRKIVWPLREVIGGMERLETELISESTNPYLRDLYEHIIQAIDTIETYRDMVTSLLDLYHTGISNRMNEIMKVLTIFASIFIPLGFLAGVYGMNFNTDASFLNMPELGFKYGYIMFWCIAISVGGGLFLFFRRKNWL